MKNTLLPLLGLWACLFNPLFAQNWSPITASDTFNYQADTASYLTHTLWVDSVQFANGDSIFFMNRVISDCDTCIRFQGARLLNQPQFLQRTVTRKANGQFVFADTVTFTVLPTAQLNDSWLFDSLRNLSATIVQVAEMPVFSGLDSVKTIRISNGDTMLLSRQHGLLRFSGYDGNRYQLVGIESRNLGEKVPDFWDFYDFEVGDVLEYEQGSCIYGDTPECHYLTEKLTIFSIQIVGDTLRYQAGRLSNSWATGAFNQPLYAYYGEDSTTVEYIDSTRHICNAYPFQAVNNASPDFSGDTLWGRLSYFPGQGNRFVKEIGPEFSAQFFRANTAFPTTHPELLIPWGAIVYERFETGLGQTVFQLDIHEAATYRRLTGAIKGGDTLGIITPDSLLMVSLETTWVKPLSIQVFPNPTGGTFEMAFSEVSRDALSYQLLDATGRAIRTGKILPGTLQTRFDLTGHPPGMYVLRLMGEGRNTTHKIVLR